MREFWPRKLKVRLRSETEKKTGDEVSRASLPVHVVIERLLRGSFQYLHSHVDRPRVAHVAHHARDLRSVGGGEVGSPLRHVVAEVDVGGGRVLVGHRLKWFGMDLARPTYLTTESA